MYTFTGVFVLMSHENNRIAANQSSGEAQPLLQDVRRRETNDTPSTARTQPNGHLSPADVQRSVEEDTIPETAVVGRNLTWTSAYLLTISRIVGSGIFATPGNIFQTVGSVGLTLTIWIVGTAIAACGLAISMELGCMLPRSGGVKVYLEFMYPRPRFLASTMVAMSAVVLGFTASNCIIFGEYMLVAMGREVTPFWQRVLAVGLLSAITLVHSCFLRAGIWIQNALAWVKIGLMAFMAVLGLVALFLPKVSSHIDATRLPAAKTWFEGSNWDVVALSTAIFKVSYSYAGYDNVNNVLNEVQSPVRTLKTMAPAALLTVFAFYLLINIAYFIVVPLEEISRSGELIAALFFRHIFGESVASTILPILVALSAAGNVMVVTFALVSFTVQCCPFKDSPDLLTHKGTPESRSRPPRLPSMGKVPRILETVQRASGWSDRALHSFIAGHRASSREGCLHFHPRCRGLSGPDICSRSRRRHLMASPLPPRPPTTVQGLESGHLAPHRIKYLPDRGTVLPTQGRKGRCRFLVCDLCCGRWRPVSLDHHTCLHAALERGC